MENRMMHQGMVRYSMCSLSPIVVLAAIASLGVVGCASTQSGEMASRIATLENQVKAQDRKVKLVAAALRTNHGSLFDAPLARFLNEKGFWEVVYGDDAACSNRCGNLYDQAIEACRKKEGEEKTLCEIDAGAKSFQCHSNCLGIGGGRR